jgi:hypothetical protein
MLRTAIGWIQVSTLSGVTIAGGMPPTAFLAG